MYRAVAIATLTLLISSPRSDAIVLCAAKSKKTGEVRQGAVARLDTAQVEPAASLVSPARRMLDRLNSAF